MTMPSSVNLQKVTEEFARARSVVAPGVNLGNRALEQKLTALMDKVRNGAEIFLLDWEGSKVPRGVVIKGQEIAWTQNGMVTAAGGSHIGTYDRLVEWGGESKEHHQMLIYIR